MKFDGPVGTMLKEHKRYAKGGRTLWAERINLLSRLEASTGGVMACCRRGIDQEDSLAADRAALASVREAVTWMRSRPEELLPLFEMTRKVSEEFRARIPEGDAMSRRQKKRFKKALKNDLDLYAETLIRTERKYGHRHLGVRTK